MNLAAVFTASWVERVWAKVTMSSLGLYCSVNVMLSQHLLTGGAGPPTPCVTPFKGYPFRALQDLRPAPTTETVQPLPVLHPPPLRLSCNNSVLQVEVFHARHALPGQTQVGTSLHLWSCLGFVQRSFHRFAVPTLTMFCIFFAYHAFWYQISCKCNDSFASLFAHQV